MLFYIIQIMRNNINYKRWLKAHRYGTQDQRGPESVSEWINGGRKIPFWVPELLPLRHMESQMKLCRMGIDDYRERLGTNHCVSIQLLGKYRINKKGPKPLTYISNTEFLYLFKFNEVRRLYSLKASTFAGPNWLNDAAWLRISLVSEN